MKNSYTQKKVVEAIGISPNTLQVYLKDKLIVPSIANPKGRGTVRLYSFSDVVQVRIMQLLSQHNYNREVMLRLSQFFNEHTKKVSNLLSPSGRRLDEEIVLLKLFGKKWSIGAETIKDVKLPDGKIFRAKKITEAEMIGDNEILMIINVSKIMKDVLGKVS